jgi:uncharacterized protein
LNNVFDRYFDILYRFAGRQRWLILAFMFGLTAIMFIGLKYVSFSSSIDSMLPSDPEVKQSMDFLKDSPISNKVVISLSLNASDRDRKDLFAAADMLAGSLQPPIFTKAVVGMSELNMAEGMGRVLNDMPYLLTPHDLDSIDRMITREKVAASMKQNYMTLLKPESIGMGGMLRSDPLGFSALMIGRTKSIADSMGYSVGIENGHFISKDGKHAMVIVTTSVPATDIEGCRMLFEELDSKLAGLPAYVSAGVVSGHSHSLSNERVIKKDIELTGTVATVAFLLLFIFVFADWRAVLIFLIPLMTIIQAIFLCHHFLGGFSYSVIGLATMLGGISADYGITVYIAARNNFNPAERVRMIFMPTLIGALTTFAVFFAFPFSNIEGYQQLGYLTILGLALSFIFSFLIIPHFVSKKDTRFSDGEALERLNIKGKYIVAFWLVPTVILSVLSFTVKFDNNIYRIDGTETEILKAEEEFARVWGSQRTAVFVSSGDTLEKALQQNDAVYQEATTIEGLRFSSIASLMPSEKTKRENLDRWNQFWQEGRADRLKALIKEEGQQYSFTDEAFQPFFDSLIRQANETDVSVAPDFLQKLQERFIHKTKDGYQILSFFPDDDRYLDVVYQISKKHEGSFLVSGKALSEKISSAVYYDIIMMSAIAAFLVILFAWMYLRNIKELLLALVPVVTGITWVFGFMSLGGIAFNLSTMITGIAIMGIGVDYGMFMIYKCRTNAKAGIVLAVLLAASATIIGTGVLVLAKHPALFYIGITMTIGLMSAYLSSLIVVPYLYRQLFRQSGAVVK